MNHSTFVLFNSLPDLIAKPARPPDSCGEVGGLCRKLGALAAPAVPQTYFCRGSQTFFSQRVGRLSWLTTDSLVLDHCDNCDRLHYDRRELTRLDVSHRAAGQTRIITGMLIGSVVGIGAGAICHGGPKCEFQSAGGPVRPLLGAALGGITAYLTSYIWDPVPAGAVSQR